MAQDVQCDCKRTGPMELPVMSLMLQSRTVTFGLLVTLGVGGCRDNLLAPEEGPGYNPARLVYFFDPVLIEMPSSTPFGSAVTITITTYGGGCIQKGRTDVVQANNHLDLFPLDIFAGPGPNCTDDLRFNTHHVSFVARLRGDLRVRIHGAELSIVDNATRRRSVTIERSLRVE